MQIGQRIKEEMMKKGISQNKLAKAAQISQSGLSSIINGASSPKENTLQAIAAALGMSASDLLGRDPGIKKEAALLDGLDDRFKSRAALLTPENLARLDAYLDGLLAGQDTKAP